jgi:hypothetical protein
MNKLNGIIDESIFDLKYLKELIIFNNQNDPLNPNRNLIFDIPDSLRRFNHLREFILRDVNLIKYIKLFNFINSSLEILDISFNKIKGDLLLNEIDKGRFSLFIFNTNLKILDISRNKFNSEINDLQFYPANLKVIKLNNNEFIGKFPYLENHKNLKILDLRNNKLEGKINVFYIILYIFNIYFK